MGKSSLTDQERLDVIADGDEGSTNDKIRAAYEREVGPFQPAREPNPSMTAREFLLIFLIVAAIITAIVLAAT